MVINIVDNYVGIMWINKKRALSNLMPFYFIYVILLLLQMHFWQHQ